MLKHVIPDATPGTSKSGKPLNANLTDLLSDRDEIHRPIWIRCPARGTEHFTGLRRGYRYALAGQGKIRSVSIRAPGKVRGTRLFHLASILAFIATREAEACNSQATTEVLETALPSIVPVSSETAAGEFKKAPHGVAVTQRTGIVQTTASTCEVLP
jgi:hypothetical protein